MATGALNSTVGGAHHFASTQWGLLLAAAADELDEDGAAADAVRAAWGDLYRAYSYPVYAFIRRRGHSRPQAQDLTQDFFVHLLEKKTLSRVDPARGRFRTFLLGALDYFLIDASRRDRAGKRGGGCELVFLDDVEAAENDYQLFSPAWETPERLLEARWAATLIEGTLRRLRDEMEAAGKGGQFDALRDYVAGHEDASYQEKAATLGLSLPALKSAIHRLRGRYAVLLRQEVARTVASPDEVEPEMRHLLAAVRR